VKEVQYCEFQQLYDYLEGKTPFSTQHKTKGTEFDNILVILDNGGWNKYNFEKMFLNTGTLSVLERTQKIFYVCCTRAKERLAVFYHEPSQEVIAKAQEWFCDEKVVSLE
ncbi:MAG: 3'-5' exonuclease, partial [bacterium]